MTFREYLVLYLVVACLTLLSIETIRVLGLPTQQNLVTIMK